MVVLFQIHDGEFRTNRTASRFAGKRKKIVTNGIVEDIGTELVESSPHRTVSVRFHVP